MSLCRFNCCKSAETVSTTHTTTTPISILKEPEKRTYNDQTDSTTVGTDVDEETKPMITMIAEEDAAEQVSMEQSYKCCGFDTGFSGFSGFNRGLLR